MSYKSYWAGRHVVYRVYDGGDRLLYVGRTSDLPRRIGEHRNDKWWWRLMFARIKVSVFPTFEAADASERIALQEEGPVFNQAGREGFGTRKHWSDSDHELYAIWYEQVLAEARLYPRPNRYGKSARLADATRRQHLSVVSA